MSRRPLYLVVPAVLACALGYLVSRPAPAATPRHTAGHAAEVEAPSAPRAARAAAPAAQTTRARYRLVWAQRAVVDGKEVAAMDVAGNWTTTPRDGGRVEVALAATRLVAKGDAAPPAAEVAAPFVLLKRLDGALGALAFEAGTTGRARDLLASLTTTFQHTVRPGDTWTVEEEDLAGRYEATYTRVGDTITRRRGRHTEMRGASGLSASGGGALHATEESVFTFDARGLVSARIALDQVTALGKGGPSLTMSLRATLVRAHVEEVALEAGPELAPEAIAPHIDRAAVARKHHEDLVGGARAPELIAAAREAAHLDRAQPGADKQRGKALRRIVALVQLDPTAAGEVASAIRQHPEDRETVGLLAGALSSAPSPAATDALASLLGESLPDDARASVLGNLGLAKAPTAASAAALTKALDTPSGPQAALALGAEAKTLGDEGGDAVSTLLARYAAATTRDEKRVYLQALANTGSREALAVILAAAGGADYDLARVAAFGLRLIPGDDVDDALWSIVRSGSPLVIEAIKAVAYRAPALWKPRLVEARTLYQSEKRVLDVIQAMLTQWANLDIPIAE